MVEVYYYLPVEEVCNAVECGIKLSKWYDKEVVTEGENKKCLSALLNPRDDIEKYKSDLYKCVKLELAPQNCFVADRYLYEIGVNCPEIMNIYSASIVPIENYLFGSYRLPECLVTGTIIAGQVKVLSKLLDSPILFYNSEHLYIDNITEAFKEKYENFNESMLYYFYCKLAEIGKVDKIEDNEKSIAVFLDKASGKATALKIPDLMKY